MELEEFRCKILKYFEINRRSFSWRQHISPYRVLVSEVMLQQTQTYRVEPKFESFMKEFPDFKTLARAPFQQVLALWKGLGYNRRALALHKTAQIIRTKYREILPEEPKELMALPGIGKATANSIVAFAYNKPVVFIETNIRTVFIKCFFPDRSSVSDSEILPLISATLDEKSPRDWYYALMDYGVMLKKTDASILRKSAHYHRQSAFKGSDRQIRGKILELLLSHHSLNKTAFLDLLKEDEGRIFRILACLCHEGLLVEKKGVMQVA